MTLFIRSLYILRFSGVGRWRDKNSTRGRPIHFADAVRWRNVLSYKECYLKAEAAGYLMVTSDTEPRYSGFHRRSAYAPQTG